MRATSGICLGAAVDGGSVAWSRSILRSLNAFSTPNCPLMTSQSDWSMRSGRDGPHAREVNITCAAAAAAADDDDDDDDDDDTDDDDDGGDDNYTL